MDSPAKPQPGAPAGSDESAFAPPPEAVPAGLASHPDYQVMRELGRGGMGVVYLAQNTLMGRPEVLKVVSSDLMKKQGVYDRFLREIRSAAKLRHPNIVTAYAALRIGESVVLAMEYVEGYDLAKMVKSNGPLPVPHACNFIYQAALGLQHAHEHGMVHRDIKPANLILSRQGKKAIIKVLDFGLAKVTSEGQADSGLTREGQMLGTPDYIAPEQIRDAQSADIRADIYSLGCTFYCLLCGRPPFSGDHLWDLYQAHFSMEARPIGAVRPEIPSQLSALVTKMMAKDPSARFQTPGDVAQALLPFFKKPGETAKGSTVELPVAEMEPLKRETAGQAPPAATTQAKATRVSAASMATPTKSTYSEVEAEAGTGPSVPGSRPSTSRWFWPSVAAAALLLGSAVTWVAFPRRKPPAPVNAKVNQPETRALIAETPAAKPEPPRALPVDQAGSTAGVAKIDTLGSGKPAAVSAAASRAVPASFTNSLGMTLKLIPAGEFRMGSRDDDAEAEKDEKPSHPVKISGFYMATHEVTQSQYQALMGTNPSFCSAGGGGRAQLAGRPSDKHPVEYVTWFDAIRFCNALSERDEFTPFYQINGDSVENVEIPNKKGPGYRLPTEAEWEYACRAGTQTKYSFGEETALLSDFAWFDQNSVRMSHPVGEKQPNKWGLYDMHGNVFELCMDLYDEGYYKHSPTDDPLKLAGSGVRSIRGGSWQRDPRWSRSADRAECGPMSRYRDVGLRLALNLSDHASVVAARALQPSSTGPNARGPLAPDPEPSANPSIDWLSPTTRMAFALIKPGEFSMGSPEDDAAAVGWEKPPHRVRITAPFFLGIYEVTQAQYQGVAGTNPSFFSATGGGRELIGSQSTAQYPVESVTWLDAIRYCNALSKKDGLPTYYHLKGDQVDCPDVKGTGYRLPSEAEWEYACRGGSTTRFAFGDSIWILDKHAWIGGSAGGIVHAVGRKEPNRFGLFDTHGNVWEWCFDWADGGYYKQSPTDDPRGAAKGTHRVVRGGSWENEPAQCRSAHLNWCGPAERWNTLGFRVARGLSTAELVSMTVAPAAVGAETKPGDPASANHRAGAPNASLAKGSPEALLKARGLIRSGSHFVLVSEAEALDKFQEIRPLIGQLDIACRKYRTALELQYRLSAAEEELKAFSQAVDEANAVLAKLPNGRNDNSAMKQAYREQRLICANLTNQRDAAAQNLDQIRSAQPPPGARDEMANAYMSKWKEFVERAPAVSKLLEKAKEEHRKLEADSEVKNALGAIRRSANGDVTISSVKNLQAGIDTIKTASKTYSPQTGAPKPKRKTKGAKR
jgi:formylglycine-generating enzyme required for sulfatase activity/serine/threonine protein kinase